MADDSRNGDVAHMKPEDDLQDHAAETVAPSAETESETRKVGLSGLIVRALFPLVILGLGVGSYFYFSTNAEKKQEEPEPKKLIRTNIAELRRMDYQVHVRTNGIVQPHNEVALSAQVAGNVTAISPEFEVGAYFSKGDVLIEIDDSDYQTAVDIANAQVQGATSAVELAIQNHDRLVELYAQKNVAEADVSQAKATLAQAEAQLDTLSAQLEQAERDLERTKVYAPFNGRVRNQTVGLGQTVSSGTPLGVVFAIDFAEVRLPIAGPDLQFLDLPELAGDEPVNVEFRNAIDTESPNVWRGQIVRTEGTLDVDSLELFAIARIDDPFGRQSGKAPLRIGLPVIASIPGRRLTNVVALPRVAVRQLDKINIVDEELTLRPQTIEAIWSDEEYVIVRDATIEDGTMLSTTQLVYAPEGAKVEIIPDIELTASVDNAAAAKAASSKN